MKKIKLLVITLAFMLSLVACKENSDTKSSSDVEKTNDATTSQSGDDSVSKDTTSNDTKSNDNTDADLATVEGWLAYWGLTEDDFKPANFTRLDKTSYNMYTQEIKAVGAYINVKLTDEDAKAWIEQMISKLSSLSEEGKLTNVLNGGEELTADYIMGENMHIGSGNFTYKGKEANAVISVIPGYLDNDDPDEAMAACTLQLEY